MPEQWEKRTNQLPVEYHLQPTFQYDTYAGMLITLEHEADGSPWDLSEFQNIHFTIRANVPQGDQLYYAELGNGITIVDSDAGQFSVDKWVCDFPRGTHHYDVKGHYTTGDWRTLLVGTLKIYLTRTMVAGMGN